MRICIEEGFDLRRETFRFTTTNTNDGIGGWNINLFHEKSNKDGLKYRQKTGAII